MRRPVCDMQKTQGCGKHTGGKNQKWCLMCSFPAGSPRPSPFYCKRARVLSGLAKETQCQLLAFLTLQEEAASLSENLGSFTHSSLLEATNTGPYLATTTQQRGFWRGEGCQIWYLRFHLPLYHSYRMH